MDDVLRKQQLTELGILHEVANYCKIRDIKYSLCSGTLLGAIRHKGFIPWDDDIDICMPRTDYENFISSWNENPIKHLVMVNHENSPSFNQTFIKICKDGTALIDDLSHIPKYHTGIAIDVFPMDRIPSGKIARRIYWYNCAKYHLLLHGYVPDNSNLLVKVYGKLILLINKDKVKAEKRLYKKITKNKNDDSLPLNFNDTNRTMLRCYPHDMFDELCDVTFEGQIFKSFKKWHEELSVEFGNYMELPPEKDRIRPHEPQYISFDKNYNE